MMGPALASPRGAVVVQQAPPGTFVQQPAGTIVQQPAGIVVQQPQQQMVMPPVAQSPGAPVPGVAPAVATPQYYYPGVVQ